MSEGRFSDFAAQMYLTDPSILFPVFKVLFNWYTAGTALDFKQEIGAGLDEGVLGLAS